VLERDSGDSNILSAPVKPLLAASLACSEALSNPDLRRNSEWNGKVLKFLSQSAKMPLKIKIHAPLEYMAATGGIFH
jgi:hypothetical protein